MKDLLKAEIIAEELDGVVGALNVRENRAIKVSVGEILLDLKSEDLALVPRRLTPPSQLCTTL
eukprot:CAMPEP_0196756612 /NCGR_PEP_ID=MMETSP1091-20130531/101588_1 /TAXON_ID=302021 /ORGANISM="Rhodomonas sp., Strain CCMP768" /LENGTH=62 /DNA_ID=CAMNT_0042105253 /DNA_START=226 /DNA_END=410 /DNA_ORIENTATION=+